MSMASTSVSKTESPGSNPGAPARDMLQGEGLVIFLGPITYIARGC